MRLADRGESREVKEPVVRSGMVEVHLKVNESRRPVSYNHRDCAPHYCIWSGGHGFVW